MPLPRLCPSTSWLPRAFMKGADQRCCAVVERWTLGADTLRAVLWLWLWRWSQLDSKQLCLKERQMCFEEREHFTQPKNFFGPCLQYKMLSILVWSWPICTTFFNSFFHPLSFPSLDLLLSFPFENDPPVYFLLAIFCFAFVYTLVFSYKRSYTIIKPACLMIYCT